MFKHKATFRKRRIYSFRVKSGEEKSNTDRMGRGGGNNKTDGRTKLKGQVLFKSQHLKECTKTESKNLKAERLYEGV